jgi:hypothetical protein
MATMVPSGENAAPKGARGKAGSGVKMSTRAPESVANTAWKSERPPQPVVIKLPSRAIAP